jgi:tetratricopeptide (TPR) repeat protein
VRDPGPGPEGGVSSRADERPRPSFEPSRWERADDIQVEADRAVGRGRGGRRPSAEAKQPARRPPRSAGPGSAGRLTEQELARALGAGRAGRANDQLREAARAFERERFSDARALLRPLAEQAPSASAVRELLGVTYYRLGRWKEAARELEAFRALTGSTEQHPVLADCYRALRRWGKVDELWRELGEASPAPDLVSEGRIVAAGALADQGDLPAAVRLLEKARRPSKRVAAHHLRVAYALADLYERSGDVARARELFRWIVSTEPGFADAGERARALA